MSHSGDLYIVIQGGLGNQLFQIACALKMAKTYNKKFTINLTTIIPNQHQQNDISITLETINSLLPDIPIINRQITYKEVFMYKEKSTDSFRYIEDKLSECFLKHNNVLLDGYFINYNYILEDVFSQLTVKPRDSRLLKYDFNDLYFIHIRLGDYLKYKMYLINLKSYYKYAIEQILKLNSKAKFIICTNQYDEELCNYLKDFPFIVDYTLQDETNTDIDTLFIMSSCRGGICSNSTLSYMGCILQKGLKSKDYIYMPYPYVAFTDNFNSLNITKDIYPPWCTIYNTLTDTIL